MAYMEVTIKSRQKAVKGKDVKFNEWHPRCREHRFKSAQRKVLGMWERWRKVNVARREHEKEDEARSMQRSNSSEDNSDLHGTFNMCQPCMVLVLSMWIPLVLIPKVTHLVFIQIEMRKKRGLWDPLLLSDKICYRQRKQWEIWFKGVTLFLKDDLSHVCMKMGK